MVCYDILLIILITNIIECVSNPTIVTQYSVRTKNVYSTFQQMRIFYVISTLGKGSKKNQLWKIPYRVLTPPPWLWKKKLSFFLKLDHFLRTFCKKCIFTIEIQKKFRKFLKNDKTTFRQANFCLLRCQIWPRRAQ